MRQCYRLRPASEVQILTVKLIWYLRSISHEGPLLGFCLFLHKCRRLSPNLILSLQKVSKARLSGTPVISSSVNPTWGGAHIENTKKTKSSSEKLYIYANRWLSISMTFTLSVKMLKDNFDY